MQCNFATYCVSAHVFCLFLKCTKFVANFVAFFEVNDMVDAYFFGFYPFKRDVRKRKIERKSVENCKEYSLKIVMNSFGSFIFL